MAKLRELNPEWSYRVFNDQEMDEYLVTHLGNDFKRLIRKLDPLYRVVLADVFRYLVIYEEGGVYLDIKSTVSRPLNDILRASDTFVLSQWPNRMGEAAQGAGVYPELARVAGGEFQQWFVIAEKNHPFLRRILDQVIDNMNCYSAPWFRVGRIGVLRVSGPIAYTLAMAPVLHKYPARFMHSAKEGLIYSLYQTPSRPHSQAHALDPNHYSKLEKPLFSD